MKSKIIKSQLGRWAKKYSALEKRYVDASSSLIDANTELFYLKEKYKKLKKKRR